MICPRQPVTGDWFNRVDWSGVDNNYGIGLPPASKNAGQWNYKRVLLANPNYKPSPALIASTAELFKVGKVVLEMPSLGVNYARDRFEQLVRMAGSASLYYRTGP